MNCGIDRRVPAAPRPRPGSVEVDLEADRRIVYHTLVCDQDSGGSRGEYEGVTTKRPIPFAKVRCD